MNKTSFPHYEELTSLANKYEGMGIFVEKLKQAKSMEESRLSLESKGAVLTEAGKRMYAKVAGAQDFVEPALKSLEAAQQENMHTADYFAEQALLYKHLLYRLFHKIPKRSQK